MIIHMWRFPFAGGNIQNQQFLLNFFILFTFEIKLCLHFAYIGIDFGAR